MRERGRDPLALGAWGARRATVRLRREAGHVPGVVAGDQGLPDDTRTGRRTAHRGVDRGRAAAARRDPEPSARAAQPRGDRRGPLRVATGPPRDRRRGPQLRRGDRGRRRHRHLQATVGRGRHGPGPGRRPLRAAHGARPPGRRPLVAAREGLLGRRPDAHDGDPQAAGDGTSLARQRPRHRGAASPRVTRPLATTALRGLLRTAGRVDGPPADDDGGARTAALRERRHRESGSARRCR